MRAAEEGARLLGPPTRGGRVILGPVLSLLLSLSPSSILSSNVVFISIDSPGAPHACYLEETGDELASYGCLIELAGPWQSVPGGLKAVGLHLHDSARAEGRPQPPSP